GIAILGLIDRLPYFYSRYAFNELFVVISWVFIWRFVDMFFFEGKKNRLKMRRLFKIFFAEYRIKASD
ncbi:MAG: hypothetical protein LBH43_18685, partial [Treponema sp.]|nr:hypothetical protein [Treponema sp.]